MGAVVESAPIILAWFASAIGAAALWSAAALGRRVDQLEAERASWWRKPPERRPRVVVWTGAIVPSLEALEALEGVHGGGLEVIRSASGRWSVVTTGATPAPLG